MQPDVGMELLLIRIIYYGGYLHANPNIKGWNFIISKDRAQIQKKTDSFAAIAAAAIAEEWNVKDRPYQALS